MASRVCGTAALSEVVGVVAAGVLLLLLLQELIRTPVAKTRRKIPIIFRFLLGRPRPSRPTNPNNKILPAPAKRVFLGSAAEATNVVKGVQVSWSLESSTV